MHHEKNAPQFLQKYESAQFFFNIDNNKNVSWAENLHIRMISEESRDAKNRVMDAENSVLHHRL